MTTTIIPDELDLIFAKPIEIGSVVYTHVQLSEPSGEQLEKLSGSTGWQNLFELIELNGSVPPQVPRKMKQRDLERAADFFAGFSSDKKGASTSPGA